MFTVRLKMPSIGDSALFFGDSKPSRYDSGRVLLISLTWEMTLNDYASAAKISPKYKSLRGIQYSRL